MATDFNKLKVVELKAELKRLGLPQNGLKAELVARLEAAETDAATAVLADSDTVPTEDVGDDRKNSDEPSEVEVEAEENAGVDSEEAAAAPIKPAMKPASEPATSPTPALLPNDAPAIEPSNETQISAPANPAPSIETSGSVPIPTQPPSSLPPSSSSATPLRPKEIMQDSQKRKRRSVSPPPVAGDIARKRARQDDEDNESIINKEGTPNTEQVEVLDVEMGDAQTDAHLDAYTNNDVANQAASEGACAQFEDGYQTDLPMQDQEQPQTYNDAAVPVEGQVEIERDVEPSVHPATSALYIKNFMRPLRPQAVQNHLLILATTPGHSTDEKTITDFYLDTIRTHAFVVFNSTSAASRVRTALHDRIWPDETNRKPLWVDFIPPEVFDDWVHMEQGTSGARGSGNRYEVVYEDGVDGDGNVTVRLEESGAAALATKTPTSQPERKPPIPTGPSRGFSGIENAPLGPRGFQQSRVPGPPVHPSRMDRVVDKTDFKSTRTYPSVSYKSVSEDLIDKRLAALRAAKSKDYDYERDVPKDYKRYFFEDGDVLVDRGPEIFLGIRPPHRERERRREQQGDRRRGGGRPGGGGGGGRRRNRRGGPPMPHGVPRGGDRYRGTATSGAPYDNRPPRGEDRGADRYVSDSRSRY
ncbi:uncharacterized protein BCR38DRAFT_431765 [Pseudomassariella vexata]|uniref:SAP domain-containing protein n=1 Tax=Pseudomassariella vexata TaxID=1141098 RepID=A0A1Y2E142_9PEZI|nr:uncharacterized protein BCR38DRAFT_431765 [Pseudomassariella vexata]ORY65064.1 hypothetical protein BCR38DRAFT_431765 [Pseudomassariella vexata]